MTPDPARARRLHPAAVGAVALSSLRSIAVPLVAVVLLGARDERRALLYAVGGLAISVGLALVQWLTTRWYLDDDVVRRRTRFIGESTTTIPYDRVQSVDTVHGPVQRLFGVVELHVQTAGGGRNGEIVLHAVTSADAEELRDAVREKGQPLLTPQRGAGTVDDAREEQPPASRWTLGRRDLVLAAATSGSLAVLLPVFAGASQVADDLVGGDAGERFVPHTWAALAVLLAAVVALAWLLSFLGTIVAFAGFTVTREGERLRIRRGVLERREASVPVARVHAVRIVESPLREPFGLAQVRIETAGYASEAASAQTLLPLVRRADVRRVLGELLPEHDAPFDDVAGVPRRSARRYVVPLLVPAVLVAGALVAVVGPAGLAAVVLVAAAAVAGLARFRAAAVGLHGDHVVLRSRGLTLARTTAAADARRLQAVRSSATLFQRRGRLASLAVDVSSGRRLRVAHLDDRVADHLLGRLAAAATAAPSRVVEQYDQGGWRDGTAG